MNSRPKWIIDATVVAFIALLTLSSGLVAKPAPSPVPASPAPSPVPVASPTPFASPKPTPTPQSSPSKQPKITWSLPELSTTMFPGTTSTTSVPFQSDQDISGLVVEATPSLNGIVSVSPSSVASITANQTYQLTVNLIATPEFQKRSFGGT